MPNRIKGITVEIGGDTTKLGSALKGLDGEIKNTQSQLRDVEKLLKFDPSNTELLRQKHKLLGDAVKETSERLDKLKEARKSAEKNMGNYDEWKKAYEGVRGEIDETSKTLEKLKKKQEELAAKGEIDTDAYRALQAQIDDTSGKLSELKKRQKEINDEFGNPVSPEQYNALKREIIDTEQKLKNLEDAANQSNVALQKIANAGEGIKKVGDKISGVGQALAPLSGAAAVGLGAVTKAAIDYETAFTGVMKTNDELVDENGNVIVSYEDLSDAIKDLSTRTASTKEEIAAVMEGAGQLGVGTEYLAGFTETMVKLGDTTNLSADEAATAIAKFANVTNMSLDDADRLGATLVDLGNNFATDEQAIMEMATRLSGAGHQIGLSEAQILGFATALSSVGIEAEMGGSAFSKAMIKMQVATETGAGAMEQVYQHYLAFSNNLNSDMDEARQYIEQYAASLAEMEANGLKGTEEYKKASEALKAWKKHLEEAEKTQATFAQVTDESGISLRELQLQMTNRSKEFKGFADNLGLTSTELTNLVNSAVNLQNFAEVAQMDVQEFTELFRTDAPAALSAFISGLGDTDAAGESTIQMLQDMGFTEVRLRDTLTRAASAQDLFAEAVQAGTDAWNANAALTEEAETRYGTVDAKVSQLRETLSNAAIDLGDVMLPLLTELIEHLKTLFASFGNLDDDTKKSIVKVGLLVAALSPLLIVVGKVISLVGTVMTLAPKLGAAIGVVKGAIALLSGPVGIVVLAVGALVGALVGLYHHSEGFRNFVNGIGENIAGMLDAAKNWGKDLIDNFVSGIVPEPIRKAVSGIAQIISDFLHFSEPEKGPLANFHTFAPDMVQMFADGINDNSGLVGTAANAVAGLVKGGLETIQTKLADVRDFWQNKWENIKTLSGEAGAQIAGKLDGLKGNLDAFRKSVSDKLSDAGNAVGKFKNGAISSWNAVADGASSLKKKLSSAFDGIRDAASDMKDKVVGAFSSMRDSIAEKIDAAKNWGKDLISNFTGGMEESQETLDNAAQDAAQVVDDNLGFSEPKRGPLAKFHTFAPDMMELFAAGILDGLDAVSDAASAVAASVSDALAGNPLSYSVAAPDFQSENAMAFLIKKLQASTDAINASFRAPTPSPYPNVPALQNAQISGANSYPDYRSNSRPISFTVNNQVGGRNVAHLQYRYDDAEASRRGPSLVKL